MNGTIPESWRAALEPVLAAPAARGLDTWLQAQEAAGKTIFPPADQRFRAFELTPLDQVRVVILGQDPYHGPGQAMGLCFSVPGGVRQPPSLANVFKELAADCGIERPVSGDLSGWARQGVLLLNTALTVEAGQAGSHAGRGWEAISDAAIAAVAARPDPTVFMLWGSHAQAKLRTIPAMSAPRHCVITSAHPSPLSAHRGFLGSRPFSRANAFLSENGRGTIAWAQTRCAAA
jgi:uracil-DNA glycosylase